MPFDYSNWEWPKPPPPQKPRWVSYQMQENCNPSKTTKMTKLHDWIGQCMVPADIVAYCKETFSSNVKLASDMPLVMPLIVIRPPDGRG